MLIAQAAETSLRFSLFPKLLNPFVYVSADGSRSRLITSLFKPFGNMPFKFTLIAIAFLRKAFLVEHGHRDLSSLRPEWQLA